MYKILSTILVLFLLSSLTSCDDKLEEFSFTYTLENINNYKVVCTFNSDKEFLIEEYNYFFDRMARKHEPKEIAGKLSEEEFKFIKSKIEDSRIFDLDNSYGFDQKSDIVFQINLEANGKDKFVLMKELNEDVLPANLIQLIKYSNEFIAKSKKEQ